MGRRINRKRFAIIGTLLLYAMAMQARPVIRIVATTNDSGSGSLRQALADAHDGEIITFAAASHGQSIILSSGELLVDKSITISGLGPSATSIRVASAAATNCETSYRNGVSGHDVKDAEWR